MLGTSPYQGLLANIITPLESHDFVGHQSVVMVVASLLEKKVRMAEFYSTHPAYFTALMLARNK